MTICAIATTMAEITIPSIAKFTMSTMSTPGACVGIGKGGRGNHQRVVADGMRSRLDHLLAFIAWATPILWGRDGGKQGETRLQHHEQYQRPEREVECCR